MTNLVEMIQAMPPAERKGAIALLDVVSRPLTSREIERELINLGVPRSRAVIIASAVKGLHLVALVGGK